MNSKKAKITLSALLTVCMIFTLTPAVSFAAGDADTAEDSVEYCLCTMEKNADTGEMVLTPEDTEAGYDGFIGQKKEIILAQRVKNNNEYGQWTEVDATSGTWKITWTLNQKDEYAQDITSASSASTRRTLEFLKESAEEPVRLTAAVVTPEGKAVECPFVMYVWDGYNPGFDPDDEDEVIKLIEKAENDKRVVELSTGGQAEGTISQNDGNIVFRFRTNKSRLFNFYSIDSNAPCCAYLYSYDSEPPEEMKRAATCEMIYADEAGEENFSISGSDYKNPLEENFDSTAYYLIVKYYKSTSKGNIKVGCDISPTGGIYDPYLYYTVNEGGSKDKVSVYEGFAFSDKDGKYVASDIIPYNYDADSDIYMEYLNSKENTKIVDGLTAGRNVIEETDDDTYVLDLDFEKAKDMLFEASIYRDAENDEWDSETITQEDFDENGNAVISLPRNSAGKTFILRLESICSSQIIAEGGEPDMIVEIPFTASESGNRIPFTVKFADGTDSADFAVNTIENQPLEIDEISLEFSGKSSPSETKDDLILSNIIFGDDFGVDNTATAYVPNWYKGLESRRSIFDIYLTDGNAETDFSQEAAGAAAAKAADNGTVESYTFKVYDKNNREKYSRQYTINFRRANPSNADLRYAFMSWVDPADESTQVQKLAFTSGSGTKNNPKKATFRMPEGVTITNEYFEAAVNAYAKQCGNIYCYDEGYFESGCSMEYSLSGEKKSETVKFKIVSPDRKNKVFYEVNVYDYDKAFSKGTVFRTESGKYKVTKTGSSSQVALIGAPSGSDTVNMAATLTSGTTKYSITAIGAKALRNSNVSNVTVGSNVKKIGASAFDGLKNLKTLKVRTKLLTKSGVKNSLRGSSITTVKCVGNAAKPAVIKKYKGIFNKSNSGKPVTVK